MLIGDIKVMSYEVHFKEEFVKKVTRDESLLCKNRTALQYHDMAGVATDRPCSSLDICSFEQLLVVNVIVYATHLSNKVLYPEQM